MSAEKLRGAQQFFAVPKTNGGRGGGNRGSRGGGGRGRGGRGGRWKRGNN
jgi:hypothetical protein